MSNGFGSTNLDREDFYTDNIVILVSRYCVASKVLLNLLGCSNYSFLQNLDLSYKELTGNFDLTDKQQYVLNMFNDPDALWQDIQEGDIELFGCAQTLSFSEWSKAELSHWWPFDPKLKNIIDSGRTFFTTAHHSRGLQWLLEIWPNAKIISMEEGSEFFDDIIPAKAKFSKIDKLQSIYNEIKQDTWPDLPPEWQENLFLPPYDQIDFSETQLDSLLENLPNKNYFDTWESINIEHRDNILKSNKPVYTWNTDYYTDKNQFFNKMKEIYISLGFEDFDEDFMDRAIDVYSNSIEILKQRVQNP